ncbi:hypothetical protein ACA910_009244 [Epithemia clementina (nom. ined.)]
MAFLYSPSSLISKCLLLLSLQASTARESEFGPGSLDNLQFFQFTKNATIQCGQTGSICGFVRDEYNADAINYGGSYSEQGVDETVWIVATATDKLRLVECKDTCIAYCFADCVCTDGATDQPCTTTTAFPTQAPVVTPSPTPYNCPLQLGKESCAAFMANNLPTTDPACDCYNFCDGVFKSCCNEARNSSSCGSTDCAGVSVLGCTKADLGVSSDGGGNPSPATSPNNSPTPSSFAVPPPPTFVGQLAAGLGAVVALAL